MTACRLSVRATEHDADRRKRVDGFAVLIDRRPLDPSNSLRLHLQRFEFDHFIFKVERINGSYGRQPAQVVQAQSQRGCRPKGRASTANRIAIAAVCQPAAASPLSDVCSAARRRVGRGIELQRKAYDVLARDELIAALEVHAESEIIEPLDHTHPCAVEPMRSKTTVRRRSCPSRAIIKAYRAKLGSERLRNPRTPRLMPLIALVWR